MVTRQAEAQWTGKLRDGEGRFQTGSGLIEGQYSFPTRFEEAKGTNPEELLAAAHAACFSMALSAGLEKGGFDPRRVMTRAKVYLEKQNGGFAINRVDLQTEAEVPEIDTGKFQELADEAKRTCPVSKLFTADIRLEAKLLTPAK